MLPKAVVFDIGNVLIKWQPEAWYDARIGEDRRRAFFDAVPIEAVNHRSDAGESLSAMIDELAALHPEWHVEVRAWYDHWPEMCAPQIDGSVDILHRLKAAGVTLVTLTNFGDETFEIARRAYPFLDLFDAHFVSARLKVMKPDAGIYQSLEQGTGLSGPDLIFADDRAENIAAAASRGWQTHHFGHAEGWADALRMTGLTF